MNRFDSDDIERVKPVRSILSRISRFLGWLPLGVSLFILSFALQGQELSYSPDIPSPGEGGGLQRIYNSIRSREPASEIRQPAAANRDDEIDDDEEEEEPEIEFESPREKEPVLQEKSSRDTVGLLGTDEIRKIQKENHSKKPAPVPEDRERREKPDTRSTRIPKRIPAERSETRTGETRADVQPVSFPSMLDPTPRKPGLKGPDFYRGIYFNNYTARKKERYTTLIDRARELGMNVIVADAQPHIPDSDFIKYARENGFHLVARVVVFEGGLKEYPPDLNHIARVLKVAENSARAGFNEIQLDYIRFADRTQRMGLSLQKRYRLIEGILKMATDRLRPLGVLVGADIFGRIAFNKNDVIGQKLEVFAPHLDTLYPMLYPSHFYGEPNRIRDPHGTVRDGARSASKRIGKHSKVVSYIQGFKMKVGPTGLSYQGYIEKQLQAADEAGDGYVVWNAGNHYKTFFSALEHHRKTTTGSKD